MHALPTVECLEVPEALEGAKSAGVMTEVSMGQRTAAQGALSTVSFGSSLGSNYSTRVQKRIVLERALIN